MHKLIPFALGALAAAIASAPASAATTEELEQRIKELEQTVLILSRKVEVADEVYVADKAKAAPNGRVKAGPEGLSIVSADSQYELKFRGTVHFDGRFGVHDDRDNDTFLFRRLRPTLEGKFGPYVAFKFMPEFSDDDADLVDGYIDANLPAAVTLRAGQFKAPVGLERLQSASALTFIERAFPTELAPNRDRGVQLSRAWFDKRLGLELALTSGAADGRNATNADGDGEQEFNARLFFEPIPGIGFGVAGSSGEKFGTGNAYLPRYRSPAQQTIFQYRTGVFADGDHERFSPQGYAFVGPFGLMAEYIESKQDLKFGTLTDTFTHDAAQITAVWAITGEDEGFKGIKPTRPGGAWELALRYSALDIDKDAFGAGFADAATQVEGADEWAIGLNWTITPNLKAFTNYTVTSFDGGAASGADRKDEKAVFTRLQLNF